MRSPISPANPPQAGDVLTTTDTLGAEWTFQVYDNEPDAQGLYSCAFTRLAVGRAPERGVWRFPLLATHTPLYRNA